MLPLDMELVLVLAKQVLTMFTLMAVGVLFVKFQKMDLTGVKYITNVLLYMVTPTLMIDSYQTAYDAIKFRGLMLALLLSFLSHGISILLNSHIFLRKGTPGKVGVERFAAIYSNAGYIGIPLIQASFGAEGVFYATAYLTAFNILMWTHGVYILKEGKKGCISVKSILLNPGVLGCIIGFLLFVTHITLPAPFGPAVHYAASMNTPLALFVSGVLLAKTDLRAALGNLRLYLISALRIVVIPILVLALMVVMRVNLWQENAGFIAVICLISTACPTAQASGFFATRCGADGEYGGQVMAVTTLACIVTLPLIAGIGASVLM